MDRNFERVVGKIYLSFLYLNTVTSTENYILVTANITEWNKKKLRLIITCNNRLATVVEFLAKKIFFVNRLKSL